MQKFLNEFSPAESGSVSKVTGEGKLKRRLFDMGVTPGARITMKKVAPLGDPIEMTIRGYELTLRKTEAENILMEVNA